MRGGEVWWNVSVEASKKKTLPLPPKGKSRRSDKRALSRRVVHERCRVILFTEDILASGDAPVESFALDVSAGGRDWSAQKRLPPGTKLIIELHARSFERSLQASVRWCNPLPTRAASSATRRIFNGAWASEISFRSEEEKQQNASIFKDL